MPTPVLLVDGVGNAILKVMSRVPKPTIAVPRFDGHRVDYVVFRHEGEIYHHHADGCECLVYRQTNGHAGRCYTPPIRKIVG